MSYLGGYLGGGSGGGGGGGGDTVPPMVTIVSPTPGTLPGAVGGFPADWGAAHMTPIILRVTDATPGIRYQCLVVRYAGSLDETVVYRRGVFRGAFVRRSTSRPIAGGVELSILPASGWPSWSALNDVVLELDAIDRAGNLT